MKKEIVVVIGVTLITILSFIFGWNMKANSNYLLTERYYYELPTGGYIYIDGYHIRLNKNPFNGTLDYQITLNYSEVNLTTGLTGLDKQASLIYTSIGGNVMKKLKCPFCTSNRMVKAGRLRSYGGYNKQRYLCNNCHRVTVKPKRS